MTFSLLRLRAQRTRAPWGARLLAAWVALSLTFAFTPCCDIVGKANAAPAPAAANHGHVPDPDVRADAHAPDTGGDSCASWLDRTDAVPPKADDAKPFLIAHIIAALPAFRVGIVAPERAGPLPRFPVSPPTRLYLRHARLIL